MLGAALVVVSGAVLVQAFARFVVEGLGTPAPSAPTEHLVVGGPYRYVRNVMYIAVTGAIAGQALLLCRADLLFYAAVVLARDGGFRAVVRGADADPPVRRAVRGLPARRPGMVAAASPPPRVSGWRRCVLCGVQGSGKTTLYRDRFLATHVHVSMDVLRTRRREAAFLELCLETRQPFVVDNTNPTPAARRRYVEPARQPGSA